MKASRFSEAQKAFILKPEGLYSQAGRRRHAGGRCLSQGRYQPGHLFQLEEKYDGLLPSEMRRLKQLEDENNKLKRIVADLSLDKEMLQNAIRRKL